MPMLIARAATKDPTKNVKLAINSTGFRPNISLILPHIGVAAELARRYALPIHVYPAEE